MKQFKRDVHLVVWRDGNGLLVGRAMQTTFECWQRGMLRGYILIGASGTRYVVECTDMGGCSPAIAERAVLTMFDDVIETIARGAENPYGN